MHAHAIERLHAMRRDNIRFVEADVLSLELPAASADVIVSTFGLKTFNRDQHKQLAAAIARTLRPGGTFSLIEASDPRGWVFRPLYRFHLAVLLPLIERLFMRGAQDFAMIATYSRKFGDCRGLAADLAEQGLEVDYRRYFFGCATGVVGRKPG
jgi:demethylmenaquinone methyltransferase/2-methoxy-6-polyprenyl-1,4-benzoquinol methylase